MRLLLVLMISFVPVVAHAGDEYKQRDALRLGIAAAINANDAKAFADLLGPTLKLDHLWFDTAACKKFSTATVKAKDYPALFACLAPLGMNAKSLLVRYGPEVTVTLQMKVIDGKVALVGLAGDPLSDLGHPEVWIDAFEAHRKSGTPIMFDDKARAELEDAGEHGAAYRICVDAKGHVASTAIVSPPGTRAVAKQITAATKDWQFEPFVVRGKPAVACALELAKLAAK